MVPDIPPPSDVPRLIIIKGYRLIQRVGGGGFSTCVRLQKAKKSGKGV